MHAIAGKTCNGCERWDYDVQPVALIVGGRVTIQRELCRACRSEAQDGFLKTRAGWRSRPLTLLAPVGARSNGSPRKAW